MRRKLYAVGSAAFIVAAMSVVGPVAPAAAGTSCLNVPGPTPGFTVGLAGQQHRIPSFSGIAVCATVADGLPVTPVVSNAAAGGCTSSCTTISLQVSPADVGALSVSFSQDGVQTKHEVDPPSVGTSSSVCLVSVGTPQAPDPGCTLSLGSDQDVAGQVAAVVAQAMQLATDTAGQAVTLANQKIAEATVLVGQATQLATDTAGQAVTLANQKIAEATVLVGQATQLATDTAGQAVTLANQKIAEAKTLVDQKVAEAPALVESVRATVEAAVASLVSQGCNSVPDGPNGEDACTNANAWILAVAVDAWGDAQDARAEVEAEIGRHLAPACDWTAAPDGTDLCSGQEQWAMSWVAWASEPGPIFEEIECFLFPENCWQQ